MKPFNLEEALAGKPVVTRDGRPYKLGGYNPEATSSKLLGWVSGIAIAHFSDGAYFNSIESNNDLFMASEKKEYWTNVYKLKSGGIITYGVFYSEEIAKSNIGKALEWYSCDYIVTVKIHEEEV